MYKTNNILFARFFSPYTTSGVHMNGFFENFDFSEIYADLDILSDIAGDLIDAYLYNEYGTRFVVSTWAHYMHWNKAEKRFDIDPDFYTAFANAFCGHIMSAQNFFDLTKIDFSEIADDVTKTKIYGNKVKTTERGDDVTTVDQHADDREDDVKQRHTKTEEDIKQRHTKTEPDIKQRQTTTENTKSAFNSSNYESDNKSVVTEAAYKDQIDVTEDAHKDQIDVTEDAHKDQIDVTEDAHKDKTTFTYGEQKTTNEHGTITERDTAHTDTETISGGKGYDREKLLKIKKELAAYNIYQLIGDAIAATMLCSDWGC